MKWCGYASGLHMCVKVSEKSLKIPKGQSKSVNRIRRAQWPTKALKRNFKQRWSIIPSISTKRAITFHLNSLITKKGPQHMTFQIQFLFWKCIRKRMKIFTFSHKALSFDTSCHFLNKLQRLLKRLKKEI